MAKHGFKRQAIGGLLLCVLSAGLVGTWPAAAHATTYCQGVVPSSQGEDQANPDSCGEDKAFQHVRFSPPLGGFAWKIDSNWGGLDDRHIVDYHWNSDQWAYSYSGPKYTYAPYYVRPAQLNVRFDGCPSAAERDLSEANQPTAKRYVWEIFDRVLNTSLTPNPPAQRSCLWTHVFTLDQQTFAGPDTRVQLTLIDDSGSQVSHSQSVQVHDHLVVALGDSYASGEGAPDDPMEPTAPFSPDRPALWEDKRCHRSANAPSAKAALMVVNGDPHTSITYLSFACSGADISMHHLNDTSSVDPYYDVHGHQDLGTGILGPYAGTDPHLYDNQLPSQIDQMTAAVGDRKIDALVVDGGGNDMNFAAIAAVCTVAYNCQAQNVFRGSDVTHNPGMAVTLEKRVDEDLNGVVTTDGSRPSLVSRYDDYARAICNPDPSSGACTRRVGKVLAMEYPDPTSDSNGATCQRILDDVIPPALSGVVEPILSAQNTVYHAETGTNMNIGDGLRFPPFGMFDWIGHGGPTDDMLGNEVTWAAQNVLGGPGQGGLNGAVYAGVQRHANDPSIPWQYVGGVASAFSGHGYCASDNWIRRADEAQYIQGGAEDNGASNQSHDTLSTQGKLHPNEMGYQAMAAKLLPSLAQLVGSGPTPPILSTFTGEPRLPDPEDFLNSTEASLVEPSGWLVGSHCPSTCANPSPHAVYHIDADSPRAPDEITDAKLTINGADCATPPPGVTCGASYITDQKLRWSLSFSADGIYRVNSGVTDALGVTTTDTREIKVDLTPPTAAATLTPPVPQAGSTYTTPVDVTLTGSDSPGGSGFSFVDYQLDGGALQTATGPITIGAGTHTLQYEANDWAWNTSDLHTLTLTVVLPPTLDAIAVTPTSQTLASGTTQQFTATGTYSDGTTNDVTGSVAWTSSDSSRATVDATGLMTAKAQGTATITATATSVSSSTGMAPAGSVDVTVGPPALAAISLSPSNPAVARGSTQQLSATGRFTDGTIADVTGSVSWLSSDNTKATVDAAGLVTARALGVSTISASEGGLSGSTALTVGPSPLVVHAPSATVTYGSPPPASLTPSYVGLVNGDLQPAGQASCSSAATQASPAGAYPITCSSAADPNYSISYVDGLLTVAPAPLTVTADNKSKVYGSPNPAFTASYAGLVNGDTLAALGGTLSLATAATTGSGTGTYTVTPSGLTSANYTISYVAGLLTVTPAPLTVTADNKTKVYGTPNPAFTTSYAGFVNGDTVSSLTALPSCSTVATTASPAGTYQITCPGAASSNYLVMNQLGSFTVVKAATTLSTSRLSATLLHPTASLSRTDNGSPISGQTIVFKIGRSGSCSAVTDRQGKAACQAVALSTQGFTASFSGDPNYLASSGSGRL